MRDRQPIPRELSRGRRSRVAPASRGIIGDQASLRQRRLPLAWHLTGPVLRYLATMPDAIKRL